MGGKEHKPEIMDLQRQIVRESEILAGLMDEALPFKYQPFRRRNWKTPRAIIPTQNPGVFDRAWLERKPASYATHSPIGLLIDRVAVLDKPMEHSVHQYVAAVHDPRSAKMEIDHPIWWSPEEMLDRIQTLGSYVTMVAEAEVRTSLLKIKPLNPNIL